MGSLLLNLVLKYVASHQEQVVEFIAEAVTAGINALKQHNSAQASQ